MDRPVSRSWIAGAVTLLGAGAIAVTPVVAPAAAIRLPDIQLTSADMILDLVRHGQSSDNVQSILGTVPPGAPLTDEGATQAAYLADPANPQALESPGFYDGIYASQFIRTQQTAQDWLTAAGAPNTPVTVLPGLNEINAGVLDGHDQTTLTGLAYLLGPLSWIFGQYWVPQLGSTVDPNGMAFETRYSDAVDQIYANGGTPGTDGNLHDVAFSHAAAISTWVMMNVKNPDFGLYFSDLTKGILPNTGQVVIEGNPTDGWTLVSWNGQDVAQNPGLLTGLIVDYRDLITAPQMAVYNIEQAYGTGDSAAINEALQAGFHQVLTAITAFPQSVIDTITGSLSDGAGTAGQSAADSIGDVLTSLAI